MHGRLDGNRFIEYVRRPEVPMLALVVLLSCGPTTPEDSGVPDDSSSDSAPPDTDETEPAPGMDLVPLAINGSPDQPRIGDSITYTLRVRNDGTQASPTFSDGVWFSSDGEFQEDEDWRVCGFSSGPVPPGEIVESEVTCEIPEIPPGKWTLLLVVDEHGDVDELDETNNTRAGGQADALVVESLPDLRFTSVAPAQAVALPGATLRVDVSITNAGASASDPFLPFKVFLSTDASLDPGDVLLEYFLAEVAIPAGGERAFYGEVVLPVPSTETSYRLIGEFDPDDEVEEADETNNVFVGDALTIRPPPTYDLAVPRVTAASHAAAWGETLGWEVELVNHGTGAVGSFDVGLHLSTDKTITPSDTKLCAVSVGGVGPGGASVLVDGECVIPDGTKGTFYLGAIADVNGAVSELSEANNTGVDATAITIGAPQDLTISRVEAKETARAWREPLGWEVDVQNLGTAAAGSFDVGLYLSTDVTVTTSDVRLCTTSVSSLAGGGAATQTGSCPVPDGLSGSYWLGAIADPSGAVAEADETNNVARDDAAQVTVTAPDWDLAATAATAGQHAVKWKDLLPVSVDVKNLGAAETPAFKVAFHLSPDPTITATDPKLCESSTGALSGGGTRNVSAVCSVPALKAGNYYLGAIVDSDGKVVETSETNNTAADPTPVVHAGVKVNLWPDYILQSDKSVKSGDRVHLQARILNDQPDPASNVEVSVYYSRDGTVTTADLLLCSYTFPDFPGYWEFSLKLDCDVPLVTAPAYYYVGIIVDPRDQVFETDETDNVEVYPWEAILVSP